MYNGGWTNLSPFLMSLNVDFSQMIFLSLSKIGLLTIIYVNNPWE